LDLSPLADLNGHKNNDIGDRTLKTTFFSRARIAASEEDRRLAGWFAGLFSAVSVPRALGRSRRAVAAVEFALAATPLLLIVFGFFAINIMFYTLSTMQNAAQYAAMMLATGRATTANSGTLVSCATTPASPSAEYYACTNGVLPGWATFQASSREDCSIPKVSVTISVNASTAALADVFSFFTGQTLSTTSVAMKQGTCP
jgi:Flp pilus assembly protein TadG